MFSSLPLVKGQPCKKMGKFHEKIGTGCLKTFRCRTPETGILLEGNGTEHCHRGEEIQRNESYIEARRMTRNEDNPANAGQVSVLHSPVMRSIPLPGRLPFPVYNSRDGDKGLYIRGS